MIDTAMVVRDEGAFSETHFSPTAIKKCGTCEKEKPLHQFNHPGSAMCHSCVKKRGNRNAVTRLRAELAKVAHGQIIAAAKGDRVDAPRISQVCATMFDLLGGVKGFCEKWQEQIALALVAHPGSKTVLDEFKAIAKMTQFSTASMERANALDSMSDEELDQAAADLVDARIAAISLSDAGDDIDFDELDQTIDIYDEDDSE